MDLIYFLFESLFHIYILVTNLDRRFEVRNGNIAFRTHRLVLKDAHMPSEYGLSLLSLGNGYEEGVEGENKNTPYLLHLIETTWRPKILHAELRSLWDPDIHQVITHDSRRRNN